MNRVGVWAEAGDRRPMISATFHWVMASPIPSPADGADRRTARLPGAALVAPLLMAVVGLLAAACSEEEPTDFTADNRSGFMAACSQPIDDTRLVGNICQCVFEQTQADIPFSRFAATDERLKALPERPLTDQITDIIADCVIEEADL